MGFYGEGKLDGWPWGREVVMMFWFGTLGVFGVGSLFLEAKVNVCWNVGFVVIAIENP